MKCYLNYNNSFLSKLCISYAINHSYSIKEVNDYLISINFNGGVSAEKSEHKVTIIISEILSEKKITI